MSRRAFYFFTAAAFAFAPMADAKPKAARAECVAAVEALPLHDLVRVAFDDHGKFKLAPSNGCLRMDEGDFPAGLFALPEFSEAYAVRAAAWVEGNYGYGSKLKVVSPRVTLLDAQFNVTRSFGVNELTRRGEQLTIDVFVNPENTAERYLLLHVEPERVGQTETRTNVGSTLTPVVVGTGVIMITSGHDKPQQIEIRAKGLFTVSLLGGGADRLREERKRD